MLRIQCPYCGLRDESEFTFGGQAHIVRPPPECSDIEWAQYLYVRENSKGRQEERWCHTFGCARWFNVTRDTQTHIIQPVSGADEPSSVPDTRAGEYCA